MLTQKLGQVIFLSATSLTVSAAGYCVNSVSASGYFVNSKRNDFLCYLSTTAYFIDS
jgi:hypothetical protein